MFFAIPSLACGVSRIDPFGPEYHATDTKSHHRGYSLYNSPLLHLQPLEFQVAFVDFYALSATCRCPKRMGSHILVEGHLPGFVPWREVHGTRPKRKKNVSGGVVCDDLYGLCSPPLRRTTMRKVIHTVYSLS